MQPRGMKGCGDASLEFLRTRFCKHHWLPDGSVLRWEGEADAVLFHFSCNWICIFPRKSCSANRIYWRMGRPKAWPTPAREAMEDVRWWSVEDADCRSEIALLSPVSSFTCSPVFWLLYHTVSSYVHTYNM